MSKQLSVIIPAFNEEKTISAVLEKVRRQELAGWEKEIIVVDDGSADGTAQIVQAASGRIILLRHSCRQGKGAALRTGLGAVSGEAVIIQDADLEYNPADWPAILRELENNPANTVVYGSRNIHPKRRGYRHYVWGVKFLTGLVNFLFGSRLTDIYTGYKLLPAKLFRSLSLSGCGFEIEAEITVKLLKRGVAIKEVPINYFPRKFKEGKKIRWFDGWRGLVTIIKGYFARSAREYQNR